MRIIHVSIYPPRGEKHSKSGGVASYTKNLIDNIPRVKGDEVFVLCNKFDKNYERYEENGIQVIRCFDKNPRYLFQLFKEIRAIKPDVLHIQQELSLYGSIITAYLLQWLIFSLRKKIRIVTTLHGVVSMKKITQEFIEENNSHMPVSIVRLAFQIIYRPLCTWSRQIIVHEDIFKEYLIHEYGTQPEKISVIHHGIEDLSSPPREESRNMLGISQEKDVVLFMGYATGYKGIDLLIEGFTEYSHKNLNAYLIIGAGKHPKLSEDAEYLLEYERLLNKAQSMIDPSQYKWVGFIEEADIAQYFSASDVSVFPYTIQMSSSGPMAISLGYNKVFLASDVFRESLDDDLLLFERNPFSLSRKLHTFFTKKTDYESRINTMRSSRLWNTIGPQTHDLYRKVGRKYNNS